MHRKIVNYADIYKDRTPISSDVDDNCIKIKDNSYTSFFNWHDDCHYDYQTLEQVFNDAQLFNLRDNKLAKNVLFKRLMDVELSNLIVPNIISFYADDEFQIWRSSKKLKVCNMFIKNLDKTKKETFPQWTAQKQKQSEYCLIAVDRPLLLFVDPTERMLFGKIKCNIVTSDIADENYFECNKAGLPECVKVLSDKIAGIKVNKKRLLEIDDGVTFRFFADKNAKYNGVEIDTDKPITCQYQNGEIKVIHFVDRKKALKDTVCEMINDIISMLQSYKISKHKQEDITTQDHTWLNNLASAINNEQTNLTINDLMNVNNYLKAIRPSLVVLLETRGLLPEEVKKCNEKIVNNLRQLKEMCEEKNICEIKSEEPKSMPDNDNNNNNDNMQIIQESDAIKNGNNENLKTLFPPNSDNLKKTIEDYVNDHQFDTAQQELDKASSLEKKYNRTLNNNIHILQASNTIKNGNDESLKTLLGPNIEDLEKTVENYVNDNTDTIDQRDVAETIASLIDKGGTNFLEKYSRIFVFSQKDKRAQQVYETYKMLAESQNEINTGDQQKQNQKMIELDSIHSINTPCGGCF